MSNEETSTTDTVDANNNEVQPNIIHKIKTNQDRKESDGTKR